MIAQPQTRAEWIASTIINRATADEDRRTAMRDAWDERIAICVEAGLSEQKAEAVAMGELKGMVKP